MRTHTRPRIYTRTNAQVLLREPALIDQAESGQLSGKALRLRLMVRVMASIVAKHTHFYILARF